MQKRLLFASLTAAALVATACAPGAGPGGGGDTSKGEIVIVSEFPTSGASAASGLPAQNGVAYLLQQNTALKGFKITFRPQDHSVNGVHDPQKATQNVQASINDDKVLGVVGPFNSSIARAIIPVANRASLALISPANTNECLTQSFPYCDPQPTALRPTGKNNYFRIAVPDTIQGPAMAEYAVNELKLKNVAVWSDNETFGKGIADNFGKKLESLGGKVVVRQDFDTKTTNDFRPFLQRAKDAGAQAVYAGAVSATKGCIPRAQMKGLLEVPYLGSDGIQDSECIKQAGDMAKDIYATVAGADATQDPGAKDIVEGFKKAFPKKEDLGAYTFMAYDSAKILLDAVSRAIDKAGGSKPSREQVTQAMSETKDVKGATGTYTLDKNGDPLRGAMSFYILKGSPADWVWTKQFPVGQ